MSRVKSGVGQSDTTDSLQAGRLAAESAMANACIDRSDFTLAFCGGNHDPIRFLRGVHEVVGDGTLTGGTAVGVITNERASYGGYEAGVAVVQASDIRFEAVAVGGLREGEQLAGKMLGQLLADRTTEDSKALFLLYDSVKNPKPLSMNVANEILSGVKTGMKDSTVPLYGGGLLSDYQFSGSYQFVGDRATTQHAVGVMISGNCRVDHAITHGCQPASAYHTITSIDGPIVRELDGRPALDVLEGIIGAGASREWQKYSLLVTLGANYGQDRYGDFNEKEYVNRLIAGVNPDDGSVVLFDSDFGPGEEVQIMRRSNEQMLVSARNSATDLLGTTEGCNPFLAIYIDCAGRTSGFCGAGEEEAAIIQDTVGRHMPLLGFYSGVEIAPMLGAPRALDWTGVLMVLSEG